MTTIEINKYFIRLWRERSYRVKHYAIIWCYGNEKYTNESWSVGIVFVAPGNSLPADLVSNKMNRATIFIPSDRFQWYLDILRNEKPITIQIVGSSDNSLYTGKEPIGEEESD